MVCVVFCEQDLLIDVYRCRSGFGMIQFPIVHQFGIQQPQWLICRRWFYGQQNQKIQNRNNPGRGHKKLVFALSWTILINFF